MNVNVLKCNVTQGNAMKCNAMNICIIMFLLFFVCIFVCPFACATCTEDHIGFSTQQCHWIIFALHSLGYLLRTGPLLFGLKLRVVYWSWRRSPKCGKKAHGMTRAWCGIGIATEWHTCHVSRRVAKRWRLPQSTWNSTLQRSPRWELRCLGLGEVKMCRSLNESSSTAGTRGTSEEPPRNLPGTSHEPPTNLLIIPDR